MSVDPLDELFENQEKVRTTGCVGMNREREHEPVVFAVKVSKVGFPQFESRSRVDETMRIWRIFDEHVRRKIVKVL